MKKFTRILICLILCVFSLGFVACDKRTEEEKNFTYPSSADLVEGNGGLAVKKGNYIYFVNGYTSITEGGLTSETTFMQGSLMLTRLDADGNLIKNDNGSIQDEHFITISHALCGYEVTDLFIFGDYLYFVSPCKETESGGKVWAKERVVFNRIKLDKTSNVEEVYRSGVKLENLEYKYYVVNGNLNILVWEKGSVYYEENGNNNALIKVDATAKSHEIIENNVLEVEFADEFNQVFYKTQKDTNYYLKQLNVSNKAITNYNTFNRDFEILAVEKNAEIDKVFIKIAHTVGSNKTDIQSSVISTRQGFETLYSYEGTNTVEITKDGNVVLINGNTFTFVKGLDETVKVTDESASSIDVIDYTNGCILYYATKDGTLNINLVSYSNAIAGSEVKIKTLTTLSEVGDDYIYISDFSEDENMLYFYKLSGDDYYLNRIKVNYNVDEVEEMIGVYEEADAPVVEEEEEIEEE